MGSTNPGPPRADVLPQEPGHPSSPLFDGMDAAARTAFLSELDRFTLPGGLMPFEENEPSDAFHIVIAGCLGVVGRTSAGADELIGRVRTGETIGELELPGGRPRAMTVVALRDTSLLRVTKLACETLSQRDPRAMLQLIVQFFARLQCPRRPGIALQAPNIVALTRLGAMAFIAVVAQSLARHVTAPGFTANVIDARTTDTERTYAILEAAHSLVIYQGETQTRAGCSCVCGVPVAYCSSRTRPSGRRGIPCRSSTPPGDCIGARWTWCCCSRVGSASPRPRIPRPCLQDNMYDRG